MILTNESGLPESVVRIAERLANSHPAMDERTYSVTEVLRSARQVVLARKHRDDVVKDVQDTFSMWFGTAIHDLMEKEGKDVPGLVTETRLSAKVATVNGDFTLSGEFDLLDTRAGILYDYKTSKVATIDKARTLKEDKWLRQLYLYAWLLEKNGYERPKKGIIVAFATDHSKVKAQTQSGYPEHPIQMLEWDLSDKEYADRVLLEAVMVMCAVDHLLGHDDENIPPCSYSDCWCTEDWAIIKPGNKRADKRFDSEEEARAYWADLPNRDDRRIYHRVSDFINCRNYCQYADFCDQWQRNKDAEQIMEDVTDDPSVPF